MNDRQPLIIYRDEVLGESETFIRGQAESLSHFQPFYVGLRRRPGLSLPESRVHIISGAGLAGKLQRARFKLLGPSPDLRSRLAAQHPVLVHAHFGPDGCNAMPLAQSLQVPLVVTLHGYDVTVEDSLLPGLYTRRRNRLAVRAARFICISEYIRRQALDKGFPASSLVVHYTGIDTDFFRANPAVRRSPIVLFVGRLVAKKGCEYLIRAVAQVQAVVPDVQLVIIGDGPLRAPLEQQASSTLNHCQFLGAQEPCVVRDWMNRAMIFSTPSVIAESGDAEGFGMVFAEAQAMGLPIVSCASGGIPEAVADNQTGFLVPERDPEALSAKLTLLLQNRSLWDGFSREGQSRARRLFDLRTQAVALEKLYERVIAECNLARRASQSGSYESGADLALARHK